MSSNKIQLNNPTNRLWTDMLKRRWYANSRINADIENLKKSRFLEIENLNKISQDTREYEKQVEKISRLTINIQKHEQARSRNFETISIISSCLTRTTC